jgi:hydroxypyruvate reductase
MIDRAICEAAFREAVLACNPAERVRESLERHPPSGRQLIGLAIGKAALAMARGAGTVARGLVVAPSDDGGALPAGWRLLLSSHPDVTQQSLAAAREAIALLESADPRDTVIALISGGASALVEQPIDGVSLDEFRARVQAEMASGTSIHGLNRLRTSLSAIKGGKLGARALAPIVTLVVSDVLGDDERVVGSGPTIRTPPLDGDRVEIVAPMASFSEAVVAALAARGVDARWERWPVSEPVAVLGEQLGLDRMGRVPGDDRTAFVAWGEPSVRVPDDHGVGGRAQQLALELARHLRGTTRSAFVAGSDGVDGPSPRGAAGAYVDGTTWDAIIAAGIEPEDALRRCDAQPALDAVGALVITGPTGINHADIMIVG